MIPMSSHICIWCIGNGPSRKDVDLSVLRRPNHLLIGCNSACAPDQVELDFGVSCHSVVDDAPGARIVLDAWVNGRLSEAWVADPPVIGESGRYLRGFESPALHRHPQLQKLGYSGSYISIRPNRGGCSGAMSVELAGMLADRVCQDCVQAPKITFVLLGHDFGGGHLLEKPGETRFGGNFQEQTLNRFLEISCEREADVDLVLACDLGTLTRAEENFQAGASTWGRSRIMDEFQVVSPEKAVDRLTR